MRGYPFRGLRVRRAFRPYLSGCRPEPRITMDRHLHRGIPSGYIDSGMAESRHASGNSTSILRQPSSSTPAKPANDPGSLESTHSIPQRGQNPRNQPTAIDLYRPDPRRELTSVCSNVSDRRREHFVLPHDTFELVPIALES